MLGFLIMMWSLPMMAAMHNGFWFLIGFLIFLGGALSKSDEEKQQELAALADMEEEKDHMDILEDEIENSR